MIVSDRFENEIEVVYVTEISSQINGFCYKVTKTIKINQSKTNERTTVM